MKKLPGLLFPVLCAGFTATAQLPATELLKDIQPGGSGSVAALDMRSRVFNNRLLFQAADTAGNSSILWSSDGTAAGTQVLSRDVVPNAYTDDTSSYVEFNGRLYFFSNSDQHVYSTDGLPANGVTEILSGTTRLYDGRRFIVYNGSLYFIAKPQYASEHYLYKTDGTSAGTMQVSTTVFAHTNSLMAIMGGKLYFSGNNSIIGGIGVTDGTSAGTSLINAQFLGQAGARNITAYNNMLIFTGEGPGGLGQELWKTDGTAAGTILVKDIQPGAGYGSPNNFRIFNNKVFFTATDTASNSELWSTDGTTAGTTKVTEINPSPASGYINGDLVPLNGKLFFVSSTPANGMELYVTDGTTSGTTLFKEFRSGNTDGIDALKIQNLKGGRLYFAAKGRTLGMDTYVTDGTTGGTDYVSDAATAINVDALCGFYLLNNRIYYAGNRQPAGYEVYSVAISPTNPQSISGLGNGRAAVYPNPTTGMVYIDTATPSPSFYVYDALGRMVLEGEVRDNRADLSSLNNGLYSVMFRSGDQRSVTRIQVQH